MDIRFKYILGRRKTHPNILELEVYKKDVRVYISVLTNVQPNQWDASRQRFNGKRPNAPLINSKLAKNISNIESAEIELEKVGKTLTKAQIRTIYKTGKIAVSPYVIRTFIEIIDEKQKSGKIKDNSYHVLRLNVESVFQRFIDNVTGESNSDITFDEFNLELVEKYHEYLMAQRLKIITIKNYHTTLKSLLNTCVLKGIILVSPYQKFVVPTEHKQSKLSLTESQISALESIDRTRLTKSMEKVLDAFLFCCYVGLRYSDIVSLTQENLKQTEGGIVLEKVTIKKDGAFLNIPLYALFDGKPEKILVKYIGNKNVFSLNMTNDNVNILLKKMCKIAGIKDNVSFHVARHTCATLLAEKTGDPYVIKQVLGHADIQVSMNYIHNSFATLEKNLKNVNWGTKK